VVAIAERGAWDELSRLCQRIGQVHFSPEQNSALYLRTFAVWGDLPTVRNLLLCSGHMLARDSREYWTAVAEQVSGASDLAQHRLTRLLPRSSAALRPMVERRLISPAVGPPDVEVRDRSLGELNPIRLVINHEAQYAVLSGGQRRWPIMTFFLVVVMVSVFLVEIPGGSEDTRNLENLGAMVVPMTGEPGEWKHYFTSGFLHFGPIHLALNMLGLIFLGRLIEWAWGPVRMLVHFLVCIVVSAALLPWVTYLPPGETAVFAGASGGIMGLLGGICGHLFVGWFRQSTPLVKNQIMMACSYILLQCVCDLMTPQVSMTCHLLGLATGIVGGMIVGLTSGRVGVSRTG
jgi:rhomboid protease GluP